MTWFEKCQGQRWHNITNVKGTAIEGVWKLFECFGIVMNYVYSRDTGTQKYDNFSVMNNKQQAHFDEPFFVLEIDGLGSRKENSGKVFYKAGNGILFFSCSGNLH